MPVILPPGLPAAAVLRGEGAPVLEARPPATSPLRVLLVNLMPDKVRTEAQFARLLAGSGHLVELTLAVPTRHVWHHTPSAHLARYYLPWEQARHGRFDALVVTGAPVERIPFEAVDYWDEIVAMLDWAAVRGLRSMFVCWAAQAALWHRFGVPKHPLSRKRFGVYGHAVLDGCELAVDLYGRIAMPVSRHTETRAMDLPAGAGLRIAAVSAQSGLGLIEDPANRSAYLFNHPEYDATALADEYARDRAAGEPIDLPANYFPDDDPGRPPSATWHASALRLYRNWLDLVDAERPCLDWRSLRCDPCHTAMRSGGLAMPPQALV